jgi:tight adherence protein B
MDLIILAITIFLVGTVIILGMLYLILSPSKARALRSRLQAIQTRDYTSDSGEDSNLIHQDILSQLPALDRFLARIPATVKLNFIIQQAGMEMPVGRLLAIMILIYTAVSTIGVLLQLNIVLVLLVALIIAAIPVLVVVIKRRRRFSLFEEQFPDAIDLLARAVRAGHAFTTGFELIGKEMPEPVAGEFRKTYEQQNLGLPLKDAFQNLLLRVPLPDVHVFVTALNIQRESGGNLAEILDNLSKIIRERFKLKKQVKVYTAQGRMSLYVLTAVAPALGVVFFFMNPDYISLLFTTSRGLKMLLTGIILQILGFITISRIVRPKI